MAAAAVNSGATGLEAGAPEDDVSTVGEPDAVGVPDGTAVDGTTADGTTTIGIVVAPEGGAILDGAGTEKVASEVGIVSTLVTIATLLSVDARPDSAGGGGAAYEADSVGAGPGLETDCVIVMVTVVGAGQTAFGYTLARDAIIDNLLFCFFLLTLSSDDSQRKRSNSKHLVSEHDDLNELMEAKVALKLEKYSS
jgi:hypothetical protein